MDASRVLIVGLARNCANEVASQIERISDSFRNFAGIDWLIIESDSSDGTLAVLEGLKDAHAVEYASLGNLREKFPKRTERLAYCRNTYLDSIHNDQRYSDVDFVVVADMDGVNSLLTAEAVSSCWEMGFDWDACFANQIGHYYDIWALRHPLWSPNDCFEQRKYLMSIGASPEVAQYLSVYGRKIIIARHIDPIPVESAFGGLGIYKRELFDGCVYVGVDGDGEERCEHVSLHGEMIAKGAKLFINPKMINGSTNDFPSKFKMIWKLLRYTLFPGGAEA